MGGTGVKAQDIMTKKVEFIDGSKTVADAIKMMNEHGVSSLIVDHRGVEDAYGIVTRKDVVNKVVATGDDPHKKTVAEIMSKPLVFASPGLEHKYAARLLATTGFRRLPVFDGKNIVGMLSNSDIFAAFSKTV
ncbi:MAG: CBS domain-containing protein [Candidatus Coatesbacteria bacterium]|nr:CBS domain-containing protein [Candidatus Coatesbacteria bacterium]